MHWNNNKSVLSLKKELTLSTTNLAIERVRATELKLHDLTMFRKNTQLRFPLYLRGKCLDLHKIFTECLRGI